MTTTFFRVLFAGTLFSVLFIQLSLAQISIDSEKLDQYLSELEEYDKFMGSVTVLHGDDVIFQNAYGFGDADQNPVHSESVYRIGSITKSYTAALILKLVEEGELELSDKLYRFYPDIPNADKITIEQLLRHRSGLYNFTNNPDYAEYYEGEKSKEELLSLFINYGTNFEPGENFEYSNTAYVLLGYIIENTTGLSYDDVLEKYITEPLGLNRTYFGTGINSERDEVHSFTYQENWTVAPQTNMIIPHGAGALVSTSEEVARFYRHLFEGDLLSDESLGKMTDLTENFGLGIFQVPFHDKTALGHNGGIDGFQSSAAYFSDDEISFALLGNAVNYPANDITIAILSAVFGHDFEIPDFESEAEIIELTEDQLEAYTGTFTSEAFPLDIEIFIQNGNLMAQATGQGAFPLTANTPTIMRFDPAGIVIEFDDLVADKYRSMELRQSGQQFRFSLINL